MNGPVERMYEERGCEPHLRNGYDLASMIIVQVNRRIVYGIEYLQMVEPKTEKSLERRGVDVAL
jgi:hypothetical protein